MGSWGDGHQAGSFVYIDDCIKGIQELTHSDVVEPINLGSDEVPRFNKSEITKVETFQFFKEKPTQHWHETRHKVAQGFLDRFVRQNIAEIDEINAEADAQRQLQARTTPALPTPAPPPTPHRHPMCHPPAARPPLRQPPPPSRCNLQKRSQPLPTAQARAWAL